MKHRNEFVTLVSSIFSEESGAAQTTWNSASKGGKGHGKSTNTTIEWIVNSSTIRLPSRINNWVLLI